MEILYIAAVAVSALFASLAVKSVKPEISIYISISAGIIILFLILEQYRTVLSYFNEIYEKISAGAQYLPIIVKVIVTAYITDFTASLCRDAGETALASKVETGGKIVLFIIAVPLLFTVIDLVDRIL